MKNAFNPFGETKGLPFNPDIKPTGYNKLHVVFHTKEYPIVLTIGVNDDVMRKLQASVFLGVELLIEDKKTMIVMQGEKYKPLTHDTNVPLLDFKEG